MHAPPRFSSPGCRLTRALRAVWFIAGLFVLLAIPVSAYGVQAHMEHYCVPKLQKHVIRILWMPCVYGLACWLALRFKARVRCVLCAILRGFGGAAPRGGLGRWRQT